MPSGTEAAALHAALRPLAEFAVESVQEYIKAVETARTLLQAARGHGFPAVVLRVARIYGPGRTWWVGRMLSGEAGIESNGSRALNMIHQGDVVGCLMAALERGVPGEVYNAVDDEPVTLREFLTWLACELNQPEPPTVPESLEINRKRGVTNKRISNRKLKETLGYAFRYPTFREGYAEAL